MRTDFSGIEQLMDSDPIVQRIRRHLDGHRAFLVGGCVRDALVGVEGGDLDVVVEGDAVGLARGLDPEAKVHTRFGTAELLVDGREVDFATARTEIYPEPGALPEVEPTDLRRDLERRDFTVNAMAIPIEPPAQPGRFELIDPTGGRRDLEKGILRLIKEDGFIEDPSRALRGARYAARFGLLPDSVTELAIGSVDLGTIGRDRLEGEIALFGKEENPVEALRIAAEWGLIEPGAADFEGLTASLELLRSDLWSDFCAREELVLAWFRQEPETIAAAREFSGDPVEASRRLEKCEPATVLLARGSGAEWMDRWRSDWSGVRLAITGDDLISRGIPAGPAVGRGLDAALRSRMEGNEMGPQEELALALKAADDG